MNSRTPTPLAQVMDLRAPPIVKVIMALVASSPPAKTHRMSPMPKTRPPTSGAQGSPASFMGPAAVNMKTSAIPM